MAHDQPVWRVKLGTAQALADIARPPMMDVNARTFRGSSFNILKVILFLPVERINTRLDARHGNRAQIRRLNLKVTTPRCLVFFTYPCKPRLLLTHLPPAPSPAIDRPGEPFRTPYPHTRRTPLSGAVFNPAP